MKNYFQILIWFTIAIIVSCSTKDPSPGIDGLTSLIKATSEPAGLNCSAGGTKIDTGVDKNRNGILDTGEIQNTVYICNGSNGTSNLIDISVEPAGTNCPNGGYKIDSGLDLSRDGVLSKNEVNKTIYLCSGNNGINGLINVVNEPAGTNCANGGIKSETGLDLNKDGVLNSNEITKTVYLCNGNNGINSLINVENEPAGVNCANGGIKIETGLDLNKDGVLNPGEITKTVYQCNDTVAGYEIGMNYGGGIIFYLDATKTHGLIAAPSDQAYAEWSPTSTTTNATGIALGTGQSNTNLITSTLGNGNYAAILCDQLVLNGFGDWFLPSWDELISLYNQKTVVGGFTDDHYWSSTETAGNTAFGLLFSNGAQSSSFAKSNQLAVRAIRAF